MHEHSFAKDGFALMAGVLSAEECEVIAERISPGVTGSGGTRCLLEQSWCESLAARLRKHPVLSKLVPSPQFLAVQCIYFEKSAARNWLVPFHQDLSIPVAERVSDPTLRGWSEKEGSIFVQAPIAVLEQLVAVRVHLDPCSEQDGPLRVVAGTHNRGRLEPEEAAAVRSASEEVVCLAQKGEALALRPLLLHASSKATGTSRRRVLHFLFGPHRLPHGLRWPHRDFMNEV